MDRVAKGTDFQTCSQKIHEDVKFLFQLAEKGERFSMKEEERQWRERERKGK